MAGDDSFCARCAALGKTCCQGRRVFLTRCDVARIAAAAPGEDFVEYCRPSFLDGEGGVGCDPLWDRVVFSGSFRVLRHRSGGDCHFLTPGGCRLAMEIRPLVCRLYPFEYNETAIKGVNGHLCPFPEAGNAPLLLALLGMDRERAEAWRKLFYRELAPECLPKADGPIRPG